MWYVYIYVHKVIFSLCLQHTLSAPTISLSEEFGLSRESFWDFEIFLYLTFVYRLPLYTVWIINHLGHKNTGGISPLLLWVCLYLTQKMGINSIWIHNWEGLKQLVNTIDNFNNKKIVDKNVCCRIVSFNLLFGNRKIFGLIIFF